MQWRGSVKVTTKSFLCVKCELFWKINNRLKSHIRYNVWSIPKFRVKHFVNLIFFFTVANFNSALYIRPSHVITAKFKVVHVSTANVLEVVSNGNESNDKFQEYRERRQVFWSFVLTFHFRQCGPCLKCSWARFILFAT